MDSDTKHIQNLLRQIQNRWGNHLNRCGFVVAGTFVFSVKGNLESQIMYLFVLSEFYLINPGQESAGQIGSGRVLEENRWLGSMVEFSHHLWVSQP